MTVPDEIGFRHDRILRLEPTHDNHLALLHEGHHIRDVLSPCEIPDILPFKLQKFRIDDGISLLVSQG